MSGITEIGGVKYLYWDSLNDDRSFLFTCGVSDKGDKDIWNIVAFNDYTRTDVINTSINLRKGKYILLGFCINDKNNSY